MIFKYYSNSISNVKIFVFLLFCFGSAGVSAGFQCNGVLSSSQTEGFKAMFNPPYSSGLSHIGGAVTPENMSKILSKEDLKSLEDKTPKVAATNTLSGSSAKLLQDWLNENAAESVPGWISTVVGISVPVAWVGLTADVFLQLINAKGDSGRIKLANIAGTVSPGGNVGVLEQVVINSSSVKKFISTYVYSYELNGSKLITPLVICASDVIVK